MAKKFKSITEAQLDFTLKFMKMQHYDDSSTVFSPVSIATAMAMMYLGAEGNTSKEISDALAEGFVEFEIHDYFTSLLKRIKNDFSLKVPSTSDISYYGEDYNPFSSYSVLETVNQVYVNEELSLKQNFVEKFDELYHGGIEKVNFAEASKVAKVF
uniref:Serpin domain-containing protein n=1 Tax=Panagrolaimus davidi TaxID=227884 RepID=A0A914PVW5_9BILA